MFRKRTTSPSSAASGLSPRAPSEIGSSNGTVPGHGNGGAMTPSSPVLIQRLIILHDGLMPQPPTKSQGRTKHRRNPQAMLSENASLEEHGEFILYYYDHSLHFSQDGSRQSAAPAKNRRPYVPSSASTKEARLRGSNGSESNTSNRSLREEKPPADYATEEAVRFAGICRALWSLPAALHSENRHTEESHASHDHETSDTEVVHLKDSTLVFVPLELNGDIFAIAQIPRADNSQVTLNKSEHSPSQHSHVGFGADPLAIKEAMLNIHAAFSLLNGGSIHRRLIRTKHLESSKDWVLEVIDNDEKEEDSFAMKDSDLSDKLKRKDDSTWEVGVPSDGEDDSQIMEQVENKLPPPKSYGRKPTKSRRRMKLSASFTPEMSLQSSCISEDGSQKSSHHLEGKNFMDYRYGGMEELFSLRREHRKLSNELREDAPTPQGVRFGGLPRDRSSGRWGSNSNAEDLFNDIANDFGHNDVERRIENLLTLLPISNLRYDLVKFYDERVFRMQGICNIMHGGVGRCMVEMVPFPILEGTSSSLANGPVRGQHPPLAPDAFVCLSASEFMKSLIYQEVPKLMGHHGGRLSGLSMFYKNRLVTSEFNLSRSTNKHGQGAIVFSPEIAYMIFEYFSSSQKKQVKDDAHQKITRITNERPPLSRWMSGLSIGAAKNYETARDDATPSDGNEKKAANVDASSGFVVHPSSCKDPHGQKNSLYVRNFKKHIWLQRIHFPCTLGFDAMSFDNETEAYAAMFESGDFSFLLFFEMPSPQADQDALTQMTEELRPKSRKANNGINKHVSSATQAFVDVLIFLGGHLADFCSTQSSHEVGSMPDESAHEKYIDSERIFPGEPGIDIICIDRDERSFVLLSQHDLSPGVVPKSDGAVSSDSTKYGLFGIGSKPKEMREDELSCCPSQYSNLLDCRHRLASYLPLDVMLAFDDMFNEIRCLSDQTNVLNCTTEANANNGMATTKSIELCTFLPKGWVYGHACGPVELYVLLDTRKFVTINDVQKAVARVRERLFNDKIR